jgi:hypothetical protein
MPVASRVSTSGAAPDAARAWPPTGTQQARKPAGGFIDCPVDYLTLPWWVYQQGAMGLDTLRVWLGTLELVEKRCCTAPEAPVHYGPEELRRLLRVPRLAPVTAALRQLEALGLLAWSPQAIEFLPQAPALQEALAQDGYQALRAHLAPGLRWVPVPRRLFVWLAQEGQPGVIATALGVLLRCMRYKARQCVAGGRVAAPWIATVFGVAERTVQRAMQTLQGCGWLARLAGPPARERPHGRYTVINLTWQRPGATDETRDLRKAVATASPEEPGMASCQNLSPLQGVGGGNLSLIPGHRLSITPENTQSCTDHQPTLFQPFQEEEHDPEPTERRPTGAAMREDHDEDSLPAARPSPADAEPVTEDDYAAATARLLSQGLDPAFLIRPVVLAEVRRVRDEAARGLAVASGQATEVPAATAVMSMPTAPVVPACAHTPTWMPPPTLRDVTLADLGDVDRLLALHQQARARGWLRGGEAEQLNVVAAAVHARRVGQTPCRLFVALLRDRRWEVITQADEDQAHRLLREHADGPWRQLAPPAARPEVPLSDDARLVLLAPQVLRQAGWRGEPFLGVKLQDPTWTRARWAQAQAELMQWRVRQAHIRQQGSGLEPPAVPGVRGEGRDTEDVAETDDAP